MNTASITKKKTMIQKLRKEDTKNKIQYNNKRILEPMN